MTYEDIFLAPISEESMKFVLGKKNKFFSGNQKAYKNIK